MAVMNTEEHIGPHSRDISQPGFRSSLALGERMLKLERGASPEVPLPPELQKLLDRKTLLLLVKGETGTGKTTAALELMSRLRTSGDTVHISTRTYPDKLVFQHALFSKLAAQKNIHFFSTLEFDPTQFVVGNNVVSGLLRLLSSMDNPLVVLDSWEGIADYVPPEARMKVEQSLMAVLEGTGARMILVSEHPETNSTLDQLAEAILVLHQRVIEDRRVRELEFRKLRGVPIRQERYLFTLAGGRLRYLEPFAFTLPERTSMFRPLENTATHMSTGSRDIDALLGGGVPRGSTVLLEIRGDVPFEGQIYVPLTALLNFLATNNAVMAFPYSDYDPTRARLFATQFMPEDVYNANMRVFTTDRVDDPVAIKFSLNPTEDFDKWLGTYSAYKAEGKTIWMLMALDTVENFYGQGAMNFFATVAARAAVNKDIQSIVARPNLALTQKVANISQLHLVLSQRWCQLILYGVKPRTGFYALQFTFGHGYPEFELIPLEDISLSDGSGLEKERVPSVTFPGRRHEVRSDFFETVMNSLTRSKKGAA